MWSLAVFIATHSIEKLCDFNRYSKRNILSLIFISVALRRFSKLIGS
ncbi:hypothetical protein [Nostoc cycadae]